LTTEQGLALAAVLCLVAVYVGYIIWSSIRPTTDHQYHRVMLGVNLCMMIVGTAIAGVEGIQFLGGLLTGIGIASFVWRRDRLKAS